MVYRDISNDHSKLNLNSEQKKFNVALMDRFFSALIDYLVISPFVSFLLFLFFKEALEYWKLNPKAAEQVQLTFIICFSYAVFFSFIQTCFIYFWKATPGQYFLKMKIDFENGDQFLFWRAFQRQFGFWISILFLGIPWLALLTHPMQKTFYDRIADCRVYSKKSQSDYLTFEFENLFWRSFSATFMIFIGLIIFVFIYSRYEDVSQRVESYKIFEKRNFFCSEIKNVGDSSRLQLALAMNLVGQLSDDCLDREADFVLWKDKKDELELAYFAKAMTEENKDNEVKYFKTSCLKNSEAFGCQLSLSFLNADFEKLYVQLKNKNTLLAKTLRYEFGLILDKRNETKANFNQLAKFDTQKLVKKYLISEILNSKNKQNNRMPATEGKDDADELIDQALELVKEL